MATRVRDLSNQIGTPYPRPFLYCSKCAAENSANHSDYFQLSPDHVFKCCRRNMLLVIRTQVLREVKP